MVDCIREFHCALLTSLDSLRAFLLILNRVSMADRPECSWEHTQLHDAKLLLETA